MGDGAAAELAGGESLEADLVVGADGHRSVVRSLFAPAGPATLTGWASLQGLMAVPLALTEGTTSIYATGGCVLRVDQGAKGDERYDTYAWFREILWLVLGRTKNEHVYYWDLEGDEAARARDTLFDCVDEHLVSP